MNKPQLYNLQRWHRIGDTYRHTETIVWNTPYAICKGKKNIVEATMESNIQYLKIVKADG